MRPKLQIANFNIPNPLIVFIGGHSARLAKLYGVA